MVHIVAHRDRCLDRVARSGAVSAATARPLQELGVRNSVALRRLLRRRVIVEAAAGRYYVDLYARDEYLSQQRQFALIGSGIVFTIIGLVVIAATLLTR